MSHADDNGFDEQLRKVLRSPCGLEFDEWCAGHPESVARLNPFVTVLSQRLRLYRLGLTAAAAISIVISAGVVSWLTLGERRGQIVSIDQKVHDEAARVPSQVAIEGLSPGMASREIISQENQRMRPMVVKYLLMVQDMNRAIRFYRDTMGFAEGFSSPQWSELRFGDAVLALHGGGDDSPKQTGLSLQYEDVLKAFEVAVKAGAVSVRAPEHRQGEPIMLATIKDPEGNEIMLTQFIGSH